MALRASSIRRSLESAKKSGFIEPTLAKNWSAKAEKCKSQHANKVGKLALP
jgi:hypothetical protein